MFKQIEEITKKLSKLCGLSDEVVKEGDDNYISRDQELKKIKGKYRQLSSELSYESYDSDNGLFIQKDNDMGFVFEISPKVGFDDNLEKDE